MIEPTIADLDLDKYLIKIMDKWHYRFLRLAREVSTWSKDPSTQVGAVLTDGGNRVLGLGYNGFPRNIADLDNRLEDRNIKYELTIHAEENACLNASSESLNRAAWGSCIYTYPFPPCTKCMVRLIQQGVSNVISFNSWPERWNESILRSEELVSEVGGYWKLYPIMELST